MHPIYLQLKKLAQLNKVFLRSIVCCYLLLLSFTSHSQVVISEVYANGSFQLTNIGTEAVDVSSYWICSFPSYVVLNSLDIACGTTIIDPTESTTFSGFEYTLGEMPGSELGLYRINDFGNANEILAYVEWGSEGHRRSSLAVEAGIWQEGNFAPNFQATESLVLMDDEWSINGEPMICPVEDTATNDDMPMTSETYTITFNADWSSETHSTDFPSNAHFSGLIGMTHTSDTTLFVIGSPASTGIKSMAETGAKIFLIQEIQQMVMQGTGGSLISGSGIDISPGSVSVDVVASSTHPLISVTSMIAPSPDWFIGVKDVELYNDGKWVDQITIPVGVYDAGTDSGESYSSSNVATEPQGLIEMITNGPLAVNGIVPSLGSITIRREGAPVDTMDNSNPIDTMETCDLSQRLITTTDTTTFCVGEGVDDLINVEVNLLQDDATYLETTWIITDTLGTILGLPAGPPFNLEDAGEGVCRIWNLNHAEGLQGLAVTNHIEELEGCYTFSNPIEVTRLSGDVCPSPVDTMETNPVDTMETNPVDTMETNPVDTMETNPVDTMETNPVDTMETNPVDTMETNPVDTMDTNPVDTMDTNPVDTMETNPVDTMETNPVDTMETNPVDTMETNPVDTMETNPIDTMETNPIDTMETNPVDTMETNPVDTMETNPVDTMETNPVDTMETNPVDTMETNPVDTMDTNPVDTMDTNPVDTMDTNPVDTMDTNPVDTMDTNPVDTMETNPVDTMETNPVDTMETNPVDTMSTVCDVAGGTLTGGPFEFCVGDSIPDNLTADAISLSGSLGANSQWVVTDSSGITILGLPENPSDVNFEEAGSGTCLIWHLAYQDSLSGVAANGLVADIQGCFSLSNAVTIIRNSGENCATDTTTTETTNPTDSMACAVSGGVIEGGPFEFCAGDTIADQIPVDGILLNDNIGTNSQWVVTDSAGVTILGLPNAPSDVDFEGAGIGVCQLWHLSYEDSLMGAVVDGNVADLQGCFSLSNPISVTRKDCGEADDEDNETEDDDMGDDENSDDTEEDMDDENNTEGEDMDDNEDGNNGDTDQDACTAPTDPTVTLQGSKKAVITWTAVDAATRYVIQIRFKGQTRWAARAVLRKSTVRIFAPAGKDYEYHIKSICGEEESEYGEIFEFTTPPRGIITSESRSSGDDFQADIVLVLPTKQLVLTPNPVKNQLQIDYPITTENTKVFIYSASGQKVYEQSLAMDTFGQTINLGHLENGFYILRIVEDGATAVSHKLIKQ